MRDLDVSGERLETLLAQGAESPQLEFVADCDLASRRDVVELVTEVGALAARGGSIVIGVDDHGNDAGLLSIERAAAFDEAVVRDKLSRYLPGSVALRVGRDQSDVGRPFVLIEVGAHPDGAVVFVADGAYEQDGKQRIAFRKGEFFVRHGTKSELPNQDDLHQITRDAVARAQLWRDEIARVEEALADVGRIAESETAGDPNARVGFNPTTRYATARKRLAGRLDALARSGGPSLPACRELAEGSTVLFYGQVVASVFAATDEIARALAQPPYSG